MNKKENRLLAICPSDIVAGIGGADRDFLATCLALFDDSTLPKHFSRLYQDSADRVSKLTGNEIDQTVREVESRRDYWHNSTYRDSQLRLFLWIYIRQAFGLPAKLSITLQGASRLADDLSAAVIHFRDPPPNKMSAFVDWAQAKGLNRQNIADRLGMAKADDGDKTTEKQPAVTLETVVVPVLDELLKQAPHRDKDAGVQVAEDQIEQATAAMRELSEDEQVALREKLGVDELNRAAAIKMLATGGGLAAVSTSVSMAGFSAYILAAQASAYIPLVSGPGLVSFVSVLSNPITMVGGTVAAVWWFGKSAGQRIKAVVACRVIAMLTIQGLQSGRAGMESALHSFAEAAMLENTPDSLSDGIRKQYLDEWRLIKDVAPATAQYPSDEVFRKMEQPLSRKMLGAGLSREEKQNLAAMSTMTVGDVLFSAAAIEPAVVMAADFSYVADIDGRFSFAQLAAAMLEKAPRSALGEEARLKGYVAEYLVAAELSAAGHVVSFPDAANEPGWDLLVDGEKFQVKFRETTQGINEAFEKYDYAIIANTELIDKIPLEYADKVFFVDGVSNELVSQVTRSSIEAGADMLDPDLFSMVIAISAFRGVKGVYDGKLSSVQAAEQIVLDGSVRVGLFATGGVVGSGAGFLLFGPAGAWVFGAGLPIIAQAGTGAVVSRIKMHAKFKVFNEWADSMHHDIDAFQAVLRQALVAKCRQQAEKYARTAKTETGIYVRWRLSDQNRFTLECEKRLTHLDRSRIESPEARLKSTMLWASGSAIHPGCYQVSLTQINERLKNRPGFVDEIDKERLIAKFQGAASEAGERSRVFRAQGGQAMSKAAEATRGLIARFRR